MGAVITFLYLLFMSGNFTIVFKKKIEEVIPFTIMISGLVLYLTAFFGKLDWGFYLLVAVSLCFPVVLLLKKENTLLGENILTPGFFVFAVLYVEI